MDAVYKQIFDELASFLPQGWKRVVFMANYSEGNYSMSFYVKDEQGAYIDYHDLGYPKMTLMKLFMSINKTIKPFRSQLSGKDLWYTMTMCVESDGAFKVNYDYDDVSERFIAYKESWKQKHLV